MTPFTLKKYSLWLLSALGIFLWIIRYYSTGSIRFIFLNWNLFLAVIPWLLMEYVRPESTSTRKMIVVGLVWLLFFPNSAYVLTDLIHLRAESSVPVWFDLLLILSYAFASLIFGFNSLLGIERLISKRLSEKASMLVVSGLLLLSGYGIYLGRFQRWNSWDIVSQPMNLISNIADHVIHPFSHPRMLLFSAVMGCLMILLYYGMFSNREANRKPSA